MSRQGKARRTQELRQRRQVSSPRSSHPGWIPPMTGLKIMTLTSLALMLFVGWQTYHQTGDMAVTTRLAVIAGISIWVIFGFVLVMTKLIRSRSTQ